MTRTKDAEGSRERGAYQGRTSLSLEKGLCDVLLGSNCLNLENSDVLANSLQLKVGWALSMSRGTDVSLILRTLF